MLSLLHRRKKGRARPTLISPASSGRSLRWELHALRISLLVLNEAEPDNILPFRSYSKEERIP